jgi:hypothetical protein
MGWYYTLHLTCKVNKDFIEFLEKDYFHVFSFVEDKNFDDKYRELLDSLPKRFQDLITIWIDLDISNRFQEYSIIGDEFTCCISKKVTRHDGDLMDDYMSFLKDIIVQISDEITFCRIESDDFGNDIWHYSDCQLRGTYFSLPEKVKNVVHTYNEDGTEIIESRVIYKHSIKKTHLLDLNRSYGL